MKYAICNETFEKQPFDEAWAVARDLGYTGIEIAPFTLLPDAEVFDVREVSAAKREEVKQQAADAGLEVVGLHWLRNRKGLISQVPTRQFAPRRSSILRRFLNCVPISGAR